MTYEERKAWEELRDAAWVFDHAPHTRKRLQDAAIAYAQATMAARLSKFLG